MANDESEEVYRRQSQEGEPPYSPNNKSVNFDEVSSYTSGDSAIEKKARSNGLKFALTLLTTGAIGGVAGFFIGGPVGAIVGFVIGASVPLIPIVIGGIAVMMKKASNYMFNNTKYSSDAKKDSNIQVRHSPTPRPSISSKKDSKSFSEKNMPKGDDSMSYDSAQDPSSKDNGRSRPKSN